MPLKYIYTYQFLHVQLFSPLWMKLVLHHIVADDRMFARQGVRKNRSTLQVLSRAFSSRNQGSRLIGRQIIVSKLRAAPTFFLFQASSESQNIFFSDEP